MAEETQAVESAAAQAAADDGKATEAAQAAGDGAETMSLEEARKLRREAQGLRKRLAELEKVENDRQQAALSESDKAQKRAAELQQQLDAVKQQYQQEIVRYQVMLQASTLGVVDPEGAAKLLDWTSLEFDDDGRPTNTDKALRDLLKAKPYLVKVEQTSAPNANVRNGNEKKDAANREEELRKRFRI